jgi:hypothetical protein
VSGRAPSAAVPPSLPPWFPGLVVQDLLEHLPHARAHQVAGCSIEIVIAAANPRSLAGVHWLGRLKPLLARRFVAFRGRAVIVHGAIVARDEHAVNRISRRASR